MFEPRFEHITEAEAIDSFSIRYVLILKLQKIMDGWQLHEFHALFQIHDPHINIIPSISRY